MSLYCVYRPPFAQTEPRVQRLPEGLTLAEVVERMELPAVFRKHGTVCVGGVEVPRGAWHLVKPKALVGGAHNAVTFHAPIMGGGGDGEKNPLALIAAIGLTILTGFVAGGGFASTLGARFAAGTIGANLLAGGISLVGSLLLNSLAPPPTLASDLGTDRTRRDASARGNVLEPNGIVPRVVGQRRMFPPLLTEPLVTFDGDDEIVEAVYGLNGPHALSDIQIGAAPVTDIAGLEIEQREGVAGDRPLTLVQRYARTQAVGQEIRGHQVSPDNAALLDPSVDVSLAVPQPQVIATRRAPDVHELQIAFPQGLGRPSATSDPVRVPIRIRIRPRGTATWRNLPEVHYQGADFRQLRATIRLRWAVPGVEAPTSGTVKGFVAAFYSTPAQTIAPASPGWLADEYFYDGAGDTYVDQNNLGSTGLQHYAMSRDVVEFTLDPSEWPRGLYEIEVRRGCAFRAGLFNPSNYKYSGTDYDFFAYFGTPPEIPFGRDDLSDTLSLLRSVSIWNQQPVKPGPFALIAIRARNQNIERLSVEAAGYVRDWDGGGWNTWTTTSNPAPHYRDVLIGAQNVDALPIESVDDENLLEWRTACANAGYTCDAVFQDTSLPEVLGVIAACGYARPYQSDKWGVVRDYDRSSEVPVQIFTPRNSADFRWTKAFKSLPDGLRVTYSSADDDGEPQQVTVFRPGITRETGLTEQVTYEGFVDEAKVRARARYDLAQLEYRNTFFSMDVGTDALVCRRGSLVGVVHDAVARNVGFARVIEGGTGGVVLDSAVIFSNEPTFDDAPNLDEVLDVDLMGERTQAQIRYPNGDVLAVDLTNATGEGATLTFSAELPRVPEGALVATRVLVPEWRRMVVFDIKPQSELTASITLVDEAPEIFAA